MNSTAETLQRQRATLDQLKRVLPVCLVWEDWLETTQELPPDFSTMSSSWELPDPLLGQSSPLISVDEWSQKREQIKAQFRQWMFGEIPPAPGNVLAQLQESVLQPGANAQKILLTFGPNQKASLQLELLIPQGAGPFPVFMTQSNHRGWALIALQRGYMGAVYAACDSQDDSESYRAIYPGYDWASLPRRAWAASRALDYVLTLPQVNPDQILLTGHSRNAKQALIAAAFDERFSAVIASSAGALGSLPTRLFSEQHFGESIELITRTFPDWFHPRLRFFTGREDRLPVDMHELLALSAPRFCLLSSAINDRCESTWAAQQSFLAARRVYQFLSVPERLSLIWRPGGHETHTETIERYLDWSDTCFERSSHELSPRFVHPISKPAHSQPFLPVNLQNYFATVTSMTEWKQIRQGVVSQIQKFLGQEPSKALNPGHDYGTEVAHLASLLDHHVDGAELVKEQLMFGDYINADIYLPRDYASRLEKLPAVLWLPPFSFPNGYRAAYFQGEQFYSRLARQGYAVFCFDPSGMGCRAEEAEHFYQRYPHWSLLGKMLRDTVSALDVLSHLPYIDTGQIWGIGYGLGSLLGLHLAALDDRLAGLAAICIPPFSDSGLGHYPLVPGLVDSQSPYDLRSLFSCVAPRPLLIVSPQLEQENSQIGIDQQVADASQIYSLFGATRKLSQASPEDYNRFSIPTQQIVLDWLKDQARKE
ncbi:MAG: hypothetical protein ABI986_00280 [Chloroflexota bacterium]